MKIFLSILAVLLLGGIAAYHIAEERKLQAANNVCSEALRKLAQPAASRAPHFVRLDVDTVLSEVASDEDYVIRANGRIVTLSNAAPSLAGPDYTIACRVKSGVLADAIWLRRP